jgi:hypothetical protein
MPKFELKQQIWNVPHEQQPRNLRQRAKVEMHIYLSVPKLRCTNDTKRFFGMVNRAQRCMGVQGYAFSDE